MKSLPELSDWRSAEHEEDEQTRARPSYVARSELNTETAGRPAYVDPLMIEPRAARRSSHHSIHETQEEEDDDEATRSPRDSYAMLDGLDASRLPVPSYVAKSERASSHVAKAERPSFADVEQPILAKSSETISRYTTEKALNNLISQESITTFAPASLGAALRKSRAAQEMRRTSTTNSDSVTTYDKLPPPPSPPSPRSSRVLLATPPDKAQSTTVADPYARTQAASSLRDLQEAVGADDVGALADDLEPEPEPLALDSAELVEIDPIHALSYPSHDDLVSMDAAHSHPQPQSHPQSHVEPSAPIDYDALRRYLFDESEQEEQPTKAREQASRPIPPHFQSAAGDEDKPTQAREIAPTSRSAMSPFEMIPPPPPPPPASTVAPKRRSRPDGAALSAEEVRTPVASLLPKLAQMQRVMEERQRLSVLPPHERFPAMQPHTPHAFLPPHPHMTMGLGPMHPMPVHDHTQAMGASFGQTPSTGLSGSNPSLSSSGSSGSSTVPPESWAESPWIVPATPRPSSHVRTERTRNKETNGTGFFNSLTFGQPWTPQLAALIIGSASLLMIGVVVVVAVFVRTATTPPPPTFSNPAPTTPMVLPPAAATAPSPAATVVPPVASSVVIAPPPVADPTPATSPSAKTSTSTTPAPTTPKPAPAMGGAPKKLASAPSPAPRDISPNPSNPSAQKKKPESKGPKSLEDILSELGEEQVKR